MSLGFCRLQAAVVSSWCVCLQFVLLPKDANTYEPGAVVRSKIHSTIHIKL
jgi:hypothetical protein